MTNPDTLNATPWDFGAIRGIATDLAYAEENPLEGALEVAGDMSILARIMRAGNQLPIEASILRRFAESSLRELVSMGDRSNPDDVQARIDKALEDIKKTLPE
jgi:hypothetical protein